MKGLDKLAVFGGMGVELVGLVALALYAGQYIDAKQEWPGYAMTFGGMLALAIWLFHVVILVKKMNKTSENNPSSH